MFGKSKSGNTKNLRENKIKKQLKMVEGVAANEQQQNRIIKYFANGQKISAVPEGEVEVSAKEREQVVADLVSGKITWQEIEGFLRNVAMPLTDTKESAAKVFGEIDEDLRQKQILAVLAGYNATDWQGVNVEDLQKLRGKPAKGQPNYRTPVGFEIFREKFIAGIEDKADVEQMQAYQQAMDGLEEKIYGRRFDYYRQILLMMKPMAKASTEDLAEVSAENLAGAEKTIDVVMTEERIEPEEGRMGTEALAAVFGGEVPRSGAAQAETVRVTGALPELASYIAISPERAMEIMGRAVISGDPWRQDGNDYLLTPNNLIGNNLLPAYELSIGEETISLSQPFQLSDGRGAALGFIPTSEGDKVRGFYLDPRTGLWHFAPDIIRGARGEGMAQVTEGYGEMSTMLPVILQKNLTEMVKNGGFREITTVNPDFLFAGTAMAYDDMQEYRAALARGQMRSDFYREVDAEPVVVNAQTKALPQLLSVNVETAPDFQRLVGHFLTYSYLAGQVKVDCFQSQDGHFTWMFCSDEYGRTWIGGIEVNSPLTATGCRKSWATAGDLMTPLYVSSTQAGSYGDPSDMRKGMVGMWNRYLSKMPVIEEYIEWRNRG